MLLASETLLGIGCTLSRCRQLRSPACDAASGAPAAAQQGWLAHTMLRSANDTENK